MARINKGLITLVGRDRENPRTHRDAFQITDGLGKMLDEHIKRNKLNKSEFIREAVAAKLEAEMPKEPLIKDKKIRKAMRAWAEANSMTCCHYECGEFEQEYAEIGAGISFGGKTDYLEERHYTIAELCGEEEE